MNRTFVAAGAFVLALCLGSAAISLSAQSAATGSSQGAVTPPASAAQTPPPPARDMPPETKAYQDAMRIADPDRKIEALRKVIADFPKAATASQAEGQILTLLIKKAGDAVKAVQEQAKKVAEGPVSDPARSAASTAANALLSANLLLDDAEIYALKAVKALDDEPAYVAAQKHAFAARQAEAASRGSSARPVFIPDEATYAERFKTGRLSALVTLGQIYDRRGKLSDAEKAFKEAFDMRLRGAPAAAAALKLAEYAKRAGRESDQFEYLTALALTGRMKLPERATYEALYKKQHGGSLDGLEAMLDERFHAQNPKLVHVTPYARTKNRTNRVVLAEIFTGAGCPPCAGADYAFEGAMERYATTELAVLMYHLHVPQPDPLSNPSAQKRAEFYTIQGVPTSAIDGTAAVGGGNAEAAPKIYTDSVEPAIEKRLIKAPAAKVDLRATSTDTAVTARVSVSKTPKRAKKLRLHVVLAEARVRYSGENGVRFHPMVVRSVARGEAGALGFPVTAGKPLKVDYAFDIAKIVGEAKDHLDDFETNNRRFGKFQFMAKKHEIDAATLSVVAFVQDEETKEILQAAIVKAGGRR